jgi:PPP family 3-phenylpropionic acid transporter
VYEPYLNPFWQALGFSPAQIGLLNAIYPAIAAFVPFLWAAYADVTNRGGAIFLINTWISALVALMLPSLTSLISVALAVLVFAVFRSPLLPLANSMAFRALTGRPQGFAAIRLWGTVGYILAAVGVGVLADRLGLRGAMYGIGLTTVGCGLAGWMGRSRERASLSPVHVRDCLRTLRDRRFVLLLVTASMARLGFGPYTTFFTIHLDHLGLSGSFAGTAWAVSAASELVVMMYWARLRALASTRTWFSLALAAHALRWLLSIPARAPQWLLALQLTHALTFGVFYLAAVEEADAWAPDGLRATAQGLFSSVVFGLSGLLGSVVSGFLYEPLGMSWLYAAASVVSAAATILYWAGTRQAAVGSRGAFAQTTRGKRR